MQCFFKNTAIYILHVKQRCERPQAKNEGKQREIRKGKMPKNRLKMKEKVEILAPENFQKRGNQLKRGTLTPLVKTSFFFNKGKKSENHVIGLLTCKRPRDPKSIQKLFFFYPPPLQFAHRVAKVLKIVD